MAAKVEAQEKHKPAAEPATAKAEAAQPELTVPFLDRLLHQARRIPAALVPRVLRQIQRTAGNRAAGSLLPTSQPENPPGITPGPESALEGRLPGVAIIEDSETATRLGARAVTNGEEIHFAPGEFAPDTAAGEQLIQHELAHVVQQRSGKVAATTQAAGMPVNEDLALEAEADQLGRQASRTHAAILPAPGSSRQGVFQRTIDFQLIDQAIQAMCAAHEAGGPPPRSAHPSTYSDRVPADVNLALWDLYKALFWQPSYGHSALFWKESALRRLQPYNEGLTALHTMPESETSIPVEGFDYLTALGEYLRTFIPAEEAPETAGAEPPAHPAEAAPAAGTAAPAAGTAAPAAGEAATYPSARTATEAEMSEIMRARAEIRITSTERRQVEFIDPQIIGLMPVRGAQGPRREVFGPLITLLNRRVTLEHDQIPDLQERIAALQGQLEGARPQRRAQLERQIVTLQGQLASRRQELATLLAGLPAARSAAQARATRYFEGRRQELTGGVTRLTERLATESAAVTQLEERLRPQVVASLYLERQVINLQLALGQGNAAELREQRQAIETELQALLAGLSPEDQEDLPQPPAAIPAPTAADLRRATQARNQARRAIAELTRARTRRERTRTTLQATPPPDTARIDQALRLVRAGTLTTMIDQTEYEAQVSGGDEISLSPVAPGLNVDRPQGYVSGGSATISDERYLEAARRAYRADATRAERARQILGTWGSNEGRGDSINTWDRARLTLGPGITAAGVLQNAFYILHESDAVVFQQLFGRFGLNILPARRGRPVQFSYVVPQPRQGEPPIPGSQPPGTRLFGNDAVDYIIRDPIMLVQLRNAGSNPVWQTAMAQAAVEFSISFAFNYRVAVPGSDQTVPWSDLMQGLDEPVIIATQAAIADNRHASGGNLQDDINGEYARLVALPQYSSADIPNHPAALTPEHRLQLARFVLRTIQRQRRSAFERSIPGFTFEGAGVQ